MITPWWHPPPQIRRPRPSIARMERSRRLYDGHHLTSDDMEYLATGRDKLPCAESWQAEVAACEAHNNPPPETGVEAFLTVAAHLMEHRLLSEDPVERDDNLRRLADAFIPESERRELRGQAPGSETTT